MWTLVLLLLISIVMFFYSERITSSFLGFFFTIPDYSLGTKESTSSKFKLYKDRFGCVCFYIFVFNFFGN